MSKQNRNLLIVGIICLIALVGIVGYTYSFFQVKDTNIGSITGTVASTGLTVEVEKLVPSTNVGLVPQLDEYITSAVVGRNNKNCVDDNGNEVCHVYSITVKNTSSVSVKVDGLIELNAGDNPNLKWAILSEYTLNMTTKPTLVSDYNLHTFKKLTKSEEYTPSEEKIYYIVVWISEINEEQNDTGSFSGTVTFKLANEISQYPKTDNSDANAPGYVEGMIPVMYDESTSKWVIADTTSSTSKYGWYDYEAKKWANAVFVTKETREKYKDESPGTIVAELDILAFYVWIPRYKYKVWNIDKIIGTSEYTYDAYNKGIEIEFISKNEEGTITCNYSFNAPSSTPGEPNETCSDTQNGEGYYTHPAFKFGNDNLEGFWMGKFEISSEDQTEENYGGGFDEELTPRILPDVMSWRGNTLDNFWKVIYDMQKEGNIYGLSTERTKLDSHMLTNMEWGAVVYLAHSKYGRCTGGENSTCTEIALNNSGDDDYGTTYTGRSAGTSNTSDYSYEGTYTYNEPSGVLASTTGNIYGVYDMSGGSDEYVMGNMGTSTGQTSGIYQYNSRMTGDNYTYVGFEKYLTTYAYGASNYNQAAYNRGRLGDATSEVILSAKTAGGWYNQTSYFVQTSIPWFTRGGVFASGGGAKSGIFSFWYAAGYDDYMISTRAALTVIAS